MEEGLEPIPAALGQEGGIHLIKILMSTVANECACMHTSINQMIVFLIMKYELLYVLTCRNSIAVCSSLQCYS